MKKTICMLLLLCILCGGISLFYQWRIERIEAEIVHLTPEQFINPNMSKQGLSEVVEKNVAAQRAINGHQLYRRRDQMAMYAGILAFATMVTGLEGIRRHMRKHPPKRT